MDLKRRARYDHQIPFKAAILDYEWIFSLTTERACYALSDREIAVIIAGLDVFRWKTRWYGDNVDANEIDALVSGIINQLMVVSEECNMGTQFRLDDCVLMYSNDGENWIPVEGWPEGAGQCFQGSDGCSPEVTIEHPPEDTHTYLVIEPCQGETQRLDLTQEVTTITQLQIQGFLDACHITHSWYREMWEYHVKPMMVSIQASYDNEIEYSLALEAAWGMFDFNPEWAVPFLFESMFSDLLEQATGNLEQFIAYLDEGYVQTTMADFYMSVLPTDWRGYWFDDYEQNWELAIEQGIDAEKAYRNAQAVAWEIDRRSVSIMLEDAPYLWDDQCPDIEPPEEWEHYLGLSNWDTVTYGADGGSGAIISVEDVNQQRISVEMTFAETNVTYLEYGFFSNSGTGACSLDWLNVADEYITEDGFYIAFGSTPETFNPTASFGNGQLMYGLKFGSGGFLGNAGVSSLNYVLIRGTGYDPFAA